MQDATGTWQLNVTQYYGYRIFHLNTRGALYGPNFRWSWSKAQYASVFRACPSPFCWLNGG